MSSNFSNKVVVVTGASRGIGASVALTLANAGAIVVGLARQTSLIDKLNENVKGPEKINAFHCDLNKEASVMAAFQWIKENFQRIDILICNAGILKANLLIESPTKDLKELCDVNIIATSLCVREGLKAMRANNTEGHIIVLNSILGHRIPELPLPLFSLYPATKHAITALCQTVRQEIRFLKLNIKLTSISPGLVDTEFLEIYSSAVDAYPKLKADDIAAAVMYALKTPDHLQVEEIILQAICRFPKEPVTETSVKN